jgi:hypothetical protein
MSDGIRSTRRGKRCPHNGEVANTHMSKDHELLGLAVDVAHAAREHGKQSPVRRFAR